MCRRPWPEAGLGVPLRRARTGPRRLGTEQDGCFGAPRRSSAARPACVVIIRQLVDTAGPWGPAFRRASSTRGRSAWASPAEPVQHRRGPSSPLSFFSGRRCGYGFRVPRNAASSLADRVSTPAAASRGRAPRAFPAARPVRSTTARALSGSGPSLPSRRRGRVAPRRSAGGRPPLGGYPGSVCRQPGWRARGAATPGPKPVGVGRVTPSEDGQPAPVPHSPSAAARAYSAVTPVGRAASQRFFQVPRAAAGPGPADRTANATRYIRIRKRTYLTPGLGMFRKASGLVNRQLALLVDGFIPASLSCWQTNVVSNAGHGKTTASLHTASTTIVGKRVGDILRSGSVLVVGDFAEGCRRMIFCRNAVFALCQPNYFVR